MSSYIPCTEASQLFYFASEHHCDSAQCRRIIVIDGNMKIHRDICAARAAGYAEYDGLPGRITTGCTNTPQLRSRYCSAHAPTAFSSVGEEAVCPHHCENGFDQVAYILDKKTTRQTSFYKVVASSTLYNTCLM